MKFKGIADIMNNPTMVDLVPFGKHKGKPVEALIEDRDHGAIANYGLTPRRAGA